MYNWILTLCHFDNNTSSSSPKNIYLSKPSFEYSPNSYFPYNSIKQLRFAASTSPQYYNSFQLFSQSSGRHTIQICMFEWRKHNLLIYQIEMAISLNSFAFRVTTVVFSFNHGRKFSASKLPLIIVVEQIHI